MKKDSHTTGPTTADPDPRKPFRKPRITEWGSIVELTSGGAQGSQDAPYAGGTGTGFTGPRRLLPL